MKKSDETFESPAQRAFEIKEKRGREYIPIEHTNEAFLKAIDETDYRYREIFKLAEMFDEKGIKYDLHTRYDGFQILAICDDGKRISFIENFGSYGGAYDLIEAWNFKEKCTPNGFLNAEEAFEYYESKGMNFF